MPVFVYFLIAIVLLAPIVSLCASAMFFLNTARFSGFKATRRQLRAWRRERLEVPAPNRRRA